MSLKTTSIAKKLSLTSFGCLTLLLVATQTGCSISSFIRSDTPQVDTKLLEAQGYSIPPGGMPMQVEPGDSTEPSIVLEVRTAGNKRHVERIPLPSDQGVFVQDLVQQAQLHQRIGKLHIHIMRPTTHGAPPVRLDLKTDSKGTTSTGTNYALFPGDHLIVNEDNSSAIEKFIMGQLGR